MTSTLVLKGNLNESWVTRLCDFNNEFSARILTRRALTTIMASGGDCALLVNGDMIMSMCIFIDIYSPKRGHTIIAYCANRTEESVRIDPRGDVQYFSPRTPESVNVQTLGILFNNRDKYRNMSFRYANYSDYELLGSQPAVSEESWNAMKMDKYIVFKDQEPVCILILWLNTWSGSKEETACCLTVVSHTASPKFSGADLIRCIRLMMNEVYSPDTAMMLCTPPLREQEMDDTMKINSTIDYPSVLLTVC